jgi:hypothetical protein
MLHAKAYKHIRMGDLCISGMATYSRHSLPTQPKSTEEKRAWLYNNKFKNRRPKQLPKVRKHKKVIE